MGHLANGDGGIGDGSKKRIFENGGSFSDAPVLKFKKRRISAIRDFPPGCGRNAVLINGRLKENGGGIGIRLVDDSNGGEEEEAVGVESNSVVRNFPDGFGRGVLMNDLKPEENDRDRDSNGVEEAVGVESNSVVRDFPEGFGRGVLPKENNGDSDGLEEVVGVESNSVIRDFPPGCGREVLPEVNDRDSVGLEEAVVVEQKASYEGELPQLPEPLVEETVKPVENIEVPTVFVRRKSVSQSAEVKTPISVDVEEEEDTSLKNFPPRRRVSAVRDFPPGCGRGAAPVNKKDGNKSVDASKNKDLGSKKQIGANEIAISKQVEERVDKSALKSKPMEGKEAEDVVKLDADGGLKKEVAQQVYVMSGGSNLKEGNTQKSGSKALPEKASSPPASSVSEKINKPATGSVELSKDMNYKRTFLGKSASDGHAINQSPGKPNYALGFAEGRDVVQSLMAKPKCPWGQGKKLHSPAVGVESPAKKRKKALKTPSSILSSVEQGKKTSESPSDLPSSVEKDKKTSKFPSGIESELVNENKTMSASAGSPWIDDREIVLSLMAAKCPWKPGKKPSKSPSSQAKKSAAK